MKKRQEVRQQSRCLLFSLFRQCVAIWLNSQEKRQKQKSTNACCVGFVLQSVLRGGPPRAEAQGKDTRTCVFGIWSHNPRDIAKLWSGDGWWEWEGGMKKAKNDTSMRHTLASGEDSAHQDDAGARKAMEARIHSSMGCSLFSFLAKACELAVLLDAPKSPKIQVGESRSKEGLLEVQKEGAK